MAERALALTRRMPWLGAALRLGLPPGLAALRWLDAAGLHLPPCLFKLATGLPCATCGTTRMARALAEGDLAAAFHWHPVAAAAVLLAPLAAAWDARRAWRREPFPEVPDTLGARLMVVGLFLAAWGLQILRGV